MSERAETCSKCEGAGSIREIENQDWPNGDGPYLGSPEECPVCHGEPFPRGDEPTSAPRRWIDDVVIALSAATAISQRTLRTGRPEGLNCGNHDRLISEANENGWTNYV